MADDQSSVAGTSIVNHDEVERSASPRRQTGHTPTHEQPIRALIDEINNVKEIVHRVDIEQGLTSRSSGSLKPTDEAALPVSKEEGLGTRDENIVWWDEPVDQDQSNPMNWSGKKKLANIAILSGMTLVTYVTKSP